MDIPQRPVLAGRVRIRFLVKKNIARAPTVAVRTETGTIQVSTPEAMGAVDLLRYVSAAGGLSHAAMVLAELAEHTDGRRLADAAKIDGEFANAQRLGYLLDHIGVGSQTSPLAVWLDEKKPRAAPLKPGKAAKGCPVNRRWKVIVNEEIEVGL
jgi:predicted transcriptional regulator of viral defense system